MKNTTLYDKILHFVVKHYVLWYFVVLSWSICDSLWHICETLWYICSIFVVFFAMGINN